MKVVCSSCELGKGRKHECRLLQSCARDAARSTPASAGSYGIAVARCAEESPIASPISYTMATHTNAMAKASSGSNPMMINNNQQVGLLVKILPHNTMSSPKKKPPMREWAPSRLQYHCPPVDRSGYSQFSTHVFLIRPSPLPSHARELQLSHDSCISMSVSPKPPPNV